MVQTAAAQLQQDMVLSAASDAPALQHASGHPATVLLVAEQLTSAGSAAQTALHEGAQQVSSVGGAQPCHATTEELHVLHRADHHREAAVLEGLHAADLQPRPPGVDIEEGQRPRWPRLRTQTDATRQWLRLHGRRGMLGRGAGWSLTGPWTRLRRGRLRPRRGPCLD
jgi:hypothetical protein